MIAILTSFIAMIDHVAPDDEETICELPLHHASVAAFDPQRLQVFPDTSVFVVEDVGARPVDEFVEACVFGLRRRSFRRW